MNKNIIKIFIIFSLVILFFSGCESETKILEKKLQKEKIEQFWKDFMAQEHKEIVALLSIKYNIEEATLENILDEYLTKHLFGYEALVKSLGKKEKKNIFDKIDLDFKGTLSMLSSKYNLSKEMLVSILIDYKCMKSKGSEE